MANRPSQLPATVAAKNRNELKQADDSGIQILLIKIAGNEYGVPIDSLNDIVVFDSVYKIPTARKEILGAVNLRGRIVTVLNVAQIFADTAKESLTAEKTDRYFAMTVAYSDDMIALLIDKVGDVVEVPASTIGRIPERSNAFLYLYCVGVAQVNDSLVMLIDVNRIIEQFTVEHGSNNSEARHVGIDINMFENPV